MLQQPKSHTIKAAAWFVRGAVVSEILPSVMPFSQNATGQLLYGLSFWPRRSHYFCCRNEQMKPAEDKQGIIKLHHLKALSPSQIGPDDVSRFRLQWISGIPCSERQRSYCARRQPNWRLTPGRMYSQGFTLVELLWAQDLGKIIGGICDSCLSSVQMERKSLLLLKRLNLQKSQICVAVGV